MGKATLSSKVLQADILNKVVLFEGIPQQEIPLLLHCLSAREESFDAGSFLMLEGDSPTHLGIILHGEIQVVQEDYLGHRTIVSVLGAGDTFGESFACAQIAAVPVSVQAVEASDILWINYNGTITTCASSCSFHHRLIGNMLELLAEKNIALSQKLRHVSRRSTEDKLFSYLSEQSRLNTSTHFTIPLNRQQLADYLCVDRSALSTELGRLQKQGRLRYHRSEFELLSFPEDIELA